MKLHDRNLLGLAVSSACVDREGFLYKRGEINRSFQRRWFVLKSNLCFYFERKSDKEPMGVIILEDFALDLLEDDEGPFGFQIAFLNGGRQYLLRAESHELMEAWMRSFAAASHVYMTLMVAELRKQVEALGRSADGPMEGTDAVGDSDGPSAPPRGRRVNPFHQSSAVLPPESRESFQALHREIGRIIQYDRANWQTAHSLATVSLIDL